MSVWTSTCCSAWSARRRLADIKRAYKRLARKYHPDINPGDHLAEQQFRQIAEAYETLIDPDRRQRYDSVGGRRSRSMASTFGFEGFDFSNARQRRFRADVRRPVRRRVPAAGRIDRRAAAERGADLHLPLRLSFEEAIRGGTRQVSVTGSCTAVGAAAPGTSGCRSDRCQHCHGTGALKSTRNHMVFSRPCATCHGTGVLSQARCPGCHGRQLEMLGESLAVNLPPGLQDGARVRLAGKGHDGPNGGPAGDLYIAVQVDSHPRFPGTATTCT